MQTAAAAAGTPTQLSRLKEFHIESYTSTTTHFGSNPYISCIHTQSQDTTSVSFISNEVCVLSTELWRSVLSVFAGGGFSPSFRFKGFVYM